MVHSHARRASLKWVTLINLAVMGKVETNVVTAYFAPNSSEDVCHLRTSVYLTKQPTLRKFKLATEPDTHSHELGIEQIIGKIQLWTRAITPIVIGLSLFEELSS